MAEHPTLIRPPPLDPSKSEIENILELTHLRDVDPVRANHTPTSAMTHV
jgi:hypothetical protein